MHPGLLVCKCAWIPYVPLLSVFLPQEQISICLVSFVSVTFTACLMTLTPVPCLWRGHWWMCRYLKVFDAIEFHGERVPDSPLVIWWQMSWEMYPGSYPVWLQWQAANLQPEKDKNKLELFRWLFLHLTETLKLVCVFSHNSLFL